MRFALTVGTRSFPNGMFDGASFRIVLSEPSSAVPYEAQSFHISSRQLTHS
jgi:hypothetical protein